MQYYCYTDINRYVWQVEKQSTEQTIEINGTAQLDPNI